MKKITILFALVVLFAVNSFAQLQCVNWVNMENEPDYAAEPYDKPTYTAMRAPDGWEFDAEGVDFAAAWELIEDEALIAKPTNTDGGDLFDLGAGDSYGAKWKAMYDDENIYVLFKWIGTDQADDGTVNMEVMFQPNYPTRYEPDFEAAGGDKVLQNHSYARFVELGGGKAVFADGLVSAVQASVGTAGSWGDNAHALEQLALVSHYWNADGGAIDAIMVLPLEALSYPKDPMGDLTDREAFTITPGETKIAWEMKSNIQISEAKVENCWSSNVNNVYAVNYYAGYLEFAEGEGGGGEENPPLQCVNWVNMENEPDYAAEPYDKKNYVMPKAPADWTYDAGSLDFTGVWDMIDNEAQCSNAAKTESGELFDLGSGDSFGAAWKAFYDDENIYVMVNWIGLDQVSAYHMELPLQPNWVDRYEPDFEAAGGDKVLQNHSYGRFIELGGAKPRFTSAGIIDEAPATMGTTASWGSNDHMLEILAVQDHYSSMEDGTLQAVIVLPLEALSYPTDPAGDLTNRTPLDVVPGETKISWEVKTHYTVEGADGESAYNWNSSVDNVYAVIYYAGYLQFGTDQMGGGNAVDDLKSDVNVFFANDMLNIKGIQKADVEIYNIGGQLVKSAQNVNLLNVSDIVDGVYFVKLNNSAKIFKLIKF
jgi:hypothetical protein